MRLLSSRHALVDFTCDVCERKSRGGARFIVPKQSWVECAQQVDVCAPCLDEALINTRRGSVK